MTRAEEVANPTSCLNRALPEDLVFVLIEHDAAAPAAIRAWIDERIRLGKNKRTDGQLIEALRIAQQMEVRQQAAVCDGCHRNRR